VTAMVKRKKLMKKLVLGTLSLLACALALGFAAAWYAFWPPA